MRFLSAHSPRLFIVFCAAILASRSASADMIYLKNGRKIIASHVTQQNGQITYETASGSLSLPASIVEKVVHDAASPDAGSSADRAANLPIAPPNGLASAADDGAA